MLDCIHFSGWNYCFISIATRSGPSWVMLQLSQGLSWRAWNPSRKQITEAMPLKPQNDFNRPFSLGRFVFPLQTTWYSIELFFYPSKNYLFICTRLFENLKLRKNSQEYHHMVWNGPTNRPVEKGLFTLTISRTYGYDHLSLATKNV